MINIVKLEAEPIVLAPSTVYFIRDTVANELRVSVTDELGAEIYSTKSQSEILTALLALRNEPNGLAGIDGNRILSSIVKVHGQNTLLVGSANDFVWRNQVAIFDTRSVSGVTPSYGVILGNYRGLIFSASALNSVYCDFILNHDVMTGSPLYPCIHWMPMSNSSGNVRWGFEYMVAKSHGREFLNTSTTIYLEQAVVSNTAYKNMLCVFPDASAIPGVSVEPGTAVKVRVFRNADNSLDTYSGTVHAWAASLHYKTANHGTNNKAPVYFI